MDHLVRHETSLKNFPITLNWIWELCPKKDPFLVVVFGDFNAKSKSWYFNDNAASQDNALENITSQFGLEQIIKEPTHILDHSSSCIDFIFRP